MSNTIEGPATAPVEDTTTPPARAMTRAVDAPDKLAQLAGAFRDPKEVSKRLAYAAAHAKDVHLVSPSTVCAQIPEGCSVTIARVNVDVEHETYSVIGGDDDGGARGGKRGLSKVALDRIAQAAGVRWDPHLTRRIDDGADPRYCAFQATGYVRALDGSEVTITASKEMDLRNGSPQIEALEARARKKKKSAEAQIRELRLHILGHAETKAKLRAIRSLGIRTAYAPDELRKPFVIARLAFTGQTEDPELRRAFATKMADSFLAASTMLYGPPPAQRQTAALPPPSPAPPVARRLEDLGDDELALED